MTCTNCGSQILEGSQFCTNCGQPIIQLQKETKPEVDTFNQLNNPVENTFSYSNEPEEKKKQISSKTIMKIVVLVVGLLIIVGLVATPFIIKSNEKKQIKNISELSVFIPSAYQKVDNAGYDVFYQNKSGTEGVGVTKINATNLEFNSYFDLNIQILEQTNFTCNEGALKSINFDKWKYTKCMYGNNEMHIYLSEKKDAFYLVVIGRDSNSDKKYFSKVEENLKFAK